MVEICPICKKEISFWQSFEEHSNKIYHTLCYSNQKKHTHKNSTTKKKFNTIERTTSPAEIEEKFSISLGERRVYVKIQNPIILGIQIAFGMFLFSLICGLILFIVLFFFFGITINSLFNGYL